MSYISISGIIHCDHCRKPIRGGHAVNGATGNHWDCQEQYRARELKETADDLVKSAYTLERAHAIIRKLVCDK